MIGQRRYVGGLLWLLLAACSSKTIKIQQIETAIIDTKSIAARFTATGILSPLITVQIGSQISGRIQTLHADFNSEVKQGQLLATIEPFALQAALAQAKANVQVATANLEQARLQAEQAKRQAERSAALNKDQLIAAAEHETIQTQANIAAAQVVASQAAEQQAQATQRQAQINLDATRIVSPIDGIVLSRNVDVGQTVAASLQAPVLFVIAENLRTMQLNASIAESDIGKVKVGMTAQFTVDAFPRQHFPAQIVQIRNAAVTVQNVVTYDAILSVENPELLLRPGMTAKVTIVYAEAKEVLAVPNSALRFRPPAVLVKEMASTPRGAGIGGLVRRLYVVEGEWLQGIVVETGLTDGQWTQLLSHSLAPGTAVVVDAVFSGDLSGSSPNKGGSNGPGMRRIY